MSYSTAVSSMKRIMAGLKIYDPEAPGISAELAAYNAGFAPLEDRINRVFDNFFVVTADSDSLRRKESFIRSPGAIDDEVRREFILNYGRKDIFEPNRERELLTVCGIEGHFEEHYGGDPHKLALTVDSVVGTTATAALERLREFLPLHIELVVTE